MVGIATHAAPQLLGVRGQRVGCGQIRDMLHHFQQPLAAVKLPVAWNAVLAVIIIIIILIFRFLFVHDIVFV